MLNYHCGRHALVYGDSAEDGRDTVDDKIADRYVLTKGRPLRGGLSEVRKAFDLEEDRTVAVKLIYGVPGEDATRRTFFDRETSTLRELSHPNIVRMVDAGWESSKDRYFIVLDWVNHSLAEILNRHGPYSWADLSVKIALPLASALAHAHLMKIEHRDIKPSNVLITDSQEPKLADFGIAKIHEQLMPSDVTLVAFRSEPYSPPERQEADPYLRDIYSLGVLIIRALSQSSLRNRADVEKALESVDAPPDVRRLLANCVSIDPSERPENGSIVYQQLSELVSGNKERQKARTNLIWLKLTVKAQQALREIAEKRGDDRTPEASLEGDLSEGAHVDYRFDPEAGQVDPDTIFVIGREFRIVLKMSETEPRFMVTSVQARDAEWLDRNRARSCFLGKVLTWTCSVPRDLRIAESGAATLTAALEEHLEAQQEKKKHAAHEGEQNQLFDQWLRLLDAREDLERGDDRPVVYSSYSIRGRNVDFSLVDPIDREVVGNEWQVVIPETRRPIARGEVINQRETTITLRLPKGRRPLPKRGQLAPYVGSWHASLQRQRDAVLKIKGGSAAKPTLRELILHPTSASRPIRVAISHWDNEQLDDGKRDAVRYALGSKDLLLIQGPPGTGKTSVITEIVGQFLRRHPAQRILIVSQTHVAVDNALERLNSAGTEGLVRLGNPEDPRIDRGVHDLLLDRKIDKWARQVRRKAEEHLAREAQRRGVEPHHLRAALDLEQLISVLANVDIVERRIEESSRDSASTDLATGLDLADDGISTQEKLDSLIERRDELLRQAREHLAGDLTLRDEVTAQEAREVIELLLGDNTKTGKRLLEVLRIQGDWLQRLASNEDLAGAFLSTARVVAGTCVGFLANRAVRDLEFDLCILDEASKATATEAMVPLSRAKQWILIGDTSQLPPMDEAVLRAPDLLAEYDLDPSFVETTLFDRLVEHTSYPVQHMLSEQYRMIRPIGDLVSSCFYNGRLRSPVDQQILGYDHIGKPVLWIDTGDLGKLRREDVAYAGDKSVVNRTEAQLVVERIEILENAVARGMVRPPAEASLDVLVIAPYRRQLEEIHRRMASLDTPHLKITIQ